MTIGIKYQLSIIKNPQPQQYYYPTKNIFPSCVLLTLSRSFQFTYWLSWSTICTVAKLVFDRKKNAWIGKHYSQLLTTFYILASSVYRDDFVHLYAPPSCLLIAVRFLLRSYITTRGQTKIGLEKLMRQYCSQMQQNIMYTVQCWSR